jgi:hypothetical protein
MANQRAVELTSRMTTDQVIDLASAEWFSDRAAQRPYVENILYRKRGWSWITEGDARSLIGMSRVGTIFQTELNPDAVRRSLALGAPLSREAWERTGRTPAMETFVAPGAPDTRGRPVWEIDSWRLG